MDNPSPKYVYNIESNTSEMHQTFCMYPDQLHIKWTTGPVPERAVSLLMADTHAAASENPGSYHTAHAQEAWRPWSNM